MLEEYQEEGSLPGVFESQLLRETDLTMAEIARQVGYESQSKFTAAFKEQYGLLPTAYRRG